MVRGASNIPSERSFGLVFSTVFSAIGLWPWIVRGADPYWWALSIALALLLCSLLRPHLLRPLNWLWYRFGLLLHGIVNPLVMGLIYFGAVVPMGLVMRLKGRDALHLRRNPAGHTYWVARVPPSPKPGSMAKQF